MNISITGAALAGLLLAGSAADASAWTRQGTVTSRLSRARGRVATLLDNRPVSR